MANHIQVLMSRSQLMEELRIVVDFHINQFAELLHQIIADFRSNIRPAYDNLIGSFRTIDWKEPWLQGLVVFHFIFLLFIAFSRRNTNFQMLLFLLALTGVYFAESINVILGNHWRSFSTQNYFDRRGIFISSVWSGPLLLNAVLILIITLFTLCSQMIKWKKAELKHKARLARNKQE